MYIFRAGVDAAYIIGDHGYILNYQSNQSKDRLSWIRDKTVHLRHAFVKHSRYKVSAKLDLSLPDSQIGAFESQL